MPRKTPGRLTLAATVLPVIDAQWGGGVSSSHVVHSGLAQSQQVLVAGTDTPTLTVRTPLSRALTVLGFVPVAMATATLTIANVTGAIIDSGSTHSSYSISSGCSACAYIDSFDVSEGGEAIASVVVRYYSDDGINDPITKGDTAAFPALTANALHHGIGPLTINGTAIPELTGYSYQSGYAFSAQRADALPFPKGETQQGGQPVLSCTVADPTALFGLLGNRGVGIASTTTAVLYSYAPVGGLLTATGAITLTIGAGFVRPTQISGAHGERVTSGCDIMATSSNGATHGIAVS
jgi:hypothetical protein